MNIHGCECMVRLEAFIDAGRPVLKKKKNLFYCVCEYAEYGFDMVCCRQWDMVFS